MTLELKDHPGYFGAFTTNEAEGAFPNGTRIAKHDSEPGDATPDGTLGRVLGSMGHPNMPGIMFYFVEWDDKPKVAIGTIHLKIRKVEE